MSSLLQSDEVVLTMGVEEANRDRLINTLNYENDDDDDDDDDDDYDHNKDDGEGYDT